MKGGVMAYTQMTPQEQAHLREYVRDCLTRFSGIRDAKETLAFAGLAVFLGAAATALASKDWPPAIAASRPWLVVLAFSVLWGFVATYLRYQLRRRRWAALRVSGSDWLLAEWLPGSPGAMARDAKIPTRRPEPDAWLLFRDLIWPVNESVVAINPELHVYPDEIETAWLRAADRGTDALTHERIIHLAGWVGYAGVVLRTLL
jgi:hypothetical protein